MRTENVIDKQKEEHILRERAKNKTAIVVSNNGQ